VGVGTIKLKEPGLQTGSFNFVQEEKRNQLTKLTLSPACKTCWTQALRHSHDWSTLFMSLF
jgi:hypothetical protein